jgi:hypothetical protein
MGKVEKAVPKGKKKEVKRVKPRNTRAATIKKIDRLLSRVVCAIYNSRCGVCGTFTKTGAAHYFGKKAFPHLRYDLRNVVWACFKCHIIDSHLRGNPEGLRDAVIKRIGEDAFAELKAQAGRYVPLAMGQYDFLFVWFSEIIAQIESGALRNPELWNLTNYEEEVLNGPQSTSGESKGAGNEVNLPRIE